MSEGFSATPMGHNKPPRDALVAADQALKAAEALISKIPQAKSQEQADEIAAGIRAVQHAEDQLEADRDARVRPLNARVKAINDEYATPKSAFTIIIAKLKTITRMWLITLDEKRKAEAEKLRKEAEEAQRRAEEAQAEAAREAERAEDGDVTEGPLRPVEAARDAQQATLEARKAEARAAAVEKASVTAGGGGAGRAVGLRWKEVVSIKTKQDAIKVVTNIGLEDPKLIEALIMAARRYEKKYKRWPVGISVEKERV